MSGQGVPEIKHSRILVAGAAGFLGSHLVDLLLEKGHEVIGLDNFQTGFPNNLKHLVSNAKFTLVRHDVRAPLPELPIVDQIYHLACPASPIQYQKDHIGTLDTCYRGTKSLLEFATQRKIRILFTSTSEVYGDPKVCPQPETYWGNVNPFGPRSCYDEGKRVGEALMYGYREQHGTDIRIARIFNTYGPRMAASDGRVVSSFIASALSGQPIQVTGDGSATRSFQYVSDCANGLYMLMNSNYAKGPVNIGNDNENTILQLAEMVAELVASTTNQQPKVSIKFLPAPVDDPTTRRPDNSLALKELGWKPIVSLDQGLRHTIRWHIQEMSRGGHHVARL
ncbi:hypothetical protein BDV39DRAFT_215090 [Aspergillus sergii]|uniref:UDP-glucuronic acid decarboxylase 1 n=1 Tax=Aspergillus sergii TaxID=1034303 RepID=A0A5N6X2J6_9EURO|nr:hypothetical protein BDV39DRAFT_215090 [Aspergillus sergii]